MELSLDPVKELVVGTGLFMDPVVTFLSEGYGNYNYKITEDDTNFVLRLKKNNEEQFADSLQREFVFLRYFESQGIDFCPQVIFYKEKAFLLESFLEGHEVLLTDLSKKQIDRFARQLYSLFSLGVEEFHRFCEENDFSRYEYESSADTVRIYGINRFEEIDKSKVNNEVIEWIKGELDKNIESFEGSSDSIGLGFSWGDIQTSVIIDESNNMYFYDFEYVNISNSPELSYIKIHGGFDDRKFDYLLERYCDYSGQEMSGILKQISKEEKITRICDVVWAAGKWAETGDEEYKEMTYERIHKYKLCIS